MPETVAAAHVTQFTEIVRHLMRLRHRFKAVPAGEIAQAQAHFQKLLRQGRDANTADYDQLYNLGILLARQEAPMTMGELSQALAVPLSTATRIVDLLVKNEYAQRLPDPADRRIVRVALTDVGQDMYRTIDGFIRQRVEHLLNYFTLAERESLVALLRKLVQALEDKPERRAARGSQRRSLARGARKDRRAGRRD